MRIATWMKKRWQRFEEWLWCEKIGTHALILITNTWGFPPSVKLRCELCGAEDTCSLTLWRLYKRMAWWSDVVLCVSVVNIAIATLMVLR